MVKRDNTAIIQIKGKNLSDFASEPWEKIQYCAGYLNRSQCFERSLVFLCFPTAGGEN